MTCLQAVKCPTSPRVGDRKGLEQGEALFQPHGINQHVDMGRAPGAGTGSLRSVESAPRVLQGREARIPPKQFPQGERRLSQMTYAPFISSF